MLTKNLTRCMVLVLFALTMMFTASVALAHDDPGSPVSTGITASITLFLNDQTTPAIPAQPLTECETVYVQATLSWAGGTNASFEGGTWTITLPDGSVVDVTPGGGVPCIGDPATSTDDPNSAANAGRGLCLGTAGTISSVLVPYTVSPADIVGGQVAFRTDLVDAFAHIGEADLAGVNGGTPIDISVELCDDGTFCNGLETCDPTIAWGTLDSRLGQCVPGETPCTDDLFCSSVVCNEETDTCDVTDESTTVCPDDLFCSSVTCNEETDACDTVDESTTVCPDDLFCSSVTCNEETNACDTVDESTTICPDDLFCSSVTCNEETDVCDTVDESTTVCPDTECTVCDEETNACVDNGLCDNVATCRTPGFWGTHGGITQKVIDNCDGCLNICGESVTNTDLQSANSALEAICVSVAGDIRLQLARQLTAASLNCCASGVGSDCSGLPVWDEVFFFCNGFCAEGVTEFTQVCIDLLDCLNNGGIILPDGEGVACQTGTCEIGGAACGENLPECPDASACIDLTDTCHTAVLGVCADGSICTTENTEDGICTTDLSVCKPGPADTSKECNKATGNINNKNSNQCTILPKPDPDADCSKFNQGETCCTEGDVTTCDEVAAPECAHDLCTTDGALDPACDPCVALICAEDGYCCDTQWDSTCVEEVLSICDLNICLP